jgi:hypothetical protein
MALVEGVNRHEDAVDSEEVRMRARDARLRRTGRRIAAASVVAVATLLLASTSAAATCYSSDQEGAWRADHIYMSKGVRGRIDHRSATPAAGRAIVHPMQIDGYSDVDFLGLGTVKGIGVPGTSCDDNFTTSWDVYPDGFTDNGETYFCNQTWGSVSNTAQDVRLTIQFMSSCLGVPRWGFYWDGDILTCKTIGATSGRGSAGAESIGTHVTQNLEVEYEVLEYRTTSGTWNDWVPNASCADPGYQVTVISNTEHWIELE